MMPNKQQKTHTPEAMPKSLMSKKTFCLHALMLSDISNTERNCNCLLFACFFTAFVLMIWVRLIWRSNAFWLHQSYIYPKYYKHWLHTLHHTLNYMDPSLFWHNEPFSHSYINQLLMWNLLFTESSILYLVQCPSKCGKTTLKIVF